MMRSIMKKPKPEKTGLCIRCLKTTDNVLEELWLNLRTKVKSIRVSKSDIVEQLILSAYKELDEKGKKSELYMALSKLK